jgi:hypothetical protein
VADFNINDPSTYSRSRSSFSGSYYYTVSVIPENPQTYTGPPYFTVTSNSLLSEEQIIEEAKAIAKDRRGSSYTDMELDFEIVDATISKDLASKQGE